MTNTPKKLNTADIIIASCGCRALVDTHVAIALGASVHPFTKITPKVNITVIVRVGFIISWCKKSLNSTVILSHLCECS
jgi:hypothetical protein